MYNRKFNIHRDFGAENELANTIMLIVYKIQDDDEREKLTDYLRKVYENQWIQSVKNSN